MTLVSLSAEDLDGIQEAIGQRVGVLVTEVAPGSAAARSGVQPNDLLLTVGQQAVASAQEVDQALAGKTGTVEMQAARRDAQGDFIPVQILLSVGAQGAVPGPATPAPTPVAPTPGPVTPVPGADPIAATGLTLEAFDEETLAAIAEALGYRMGVLVTGLRAGSPAALAGVQEHDVLVGLIDQTVDSLAEVREALAGRTGGVDALILRKGQDGEWEILEVTMNLPGGGGPALPPNEAPPPPDPAGDLQQQLDALDAARAAGVLTEEEHQAKRAELLARAQPAAPAPDPATQQKLAALEAARQAGILTEEEYARKRTDILGQAAPTHTPPDQPAQPAPAPPAAGQGDPVNSYFDMMDFIRTEAWGRPFTTPQPERQRVGALLQQELTEAGDQGLAALQQLPAIWAHIQGNWAQASEEKRAEQREHWRNELVSPARLVPPPPQSNTFRGRNDRIVFDHPADWMAVQTEDEDTQYLFVGPAAETTWQQVLDPAASPPGALLAITPMDEETRAIPSTLEGARLIARNFVSVGGAEMREVAALTVGEAGFVALRGRHAGRAEEVFYWVAVVPYGPDYLLAGRFGGPVAQCESLLPGFSHMVATMQLTPPGGADDYASVRNAYLMTRTGNIATSGPW